jgi:hypothetical protein
MEHETYHVVFYHCARLRGADRHIANVALDYVVDAVIEVDHERNQRPGQLWGGNLGAPLSLAKLLDYIDGNSELPKENMMYADKTLHGRSPENIYDEIMTHIEKSPRRCPDCGALSLDPKTGKPKKGSGCGKGAEKKDEKGKGEDGAEGDGADGAGAGSGAGSGAGDGNGSGDEDGGSGDGAGNGSGTSPGSGAGCCPTCGAEGDGCGGAGGGGDSRGLPSTLDSHVDTAVTKQEVQADTMRAANQASTMRGTVPSEVESLLGELVKPQLRFVDIVRSAMMRKVQDAGMKNDWKRFRRRYISATPRQYLPKRHTHMPRWLCMLDTSGSMSDDDIRFGISQLQVLGNQTEGTVVPCDAEPHWEAAVKVRNMAELKKTRPVGRGGTDFTTYLRDFPTKMGTDFDVLVIITDGYCGEIPLELKPKKMDVCWVITRPDHEAFKPPFGRVCRLREHHL